MMMNKKSFYIILIIGLITVSSCHSPSTNYKEIKTSELQENLLNSFINSYKENEYPAYYGGSYVKDDHLTILVLGDTSRVRQKIVERCKGTNIYLFQCSEPSDATRKILHELQNFRNNPENKQFMEELKFKSCYLNSNGRVSIELLSFQEDIFRKKIMDSPLLDFEQTIIEPH